MSTSLTIKKTTSLHRRRPSTPPIDSDNLEEVILHKIDTFLYKLETRLDSLEVFGLEKLSQVDESVQHAYEVLARVRNEVIGEGWRKAESLVRIIEEQYDALRGSIDDGSDGSDHHDEQKSASSHLTIPPSSYNESNKVTEALKQLENKLQDLEDKYNSFSLSSTVTQALQAAKSRLLTYDELPHEWRENPYIIRGYRFCKSYTDCVYSLVKVHNETCNIWTHVIGFFIMLALAFFHLPNTISWQDATMQDRITMIVFLVAAMKCLACSAVWHTFNGIAHLDAKNKFACVDYTGITVLIAASILTTEYTALYCKPWPRNVYMLITAVSGIGGTVFTWDPSFDTPEGKPRRIGFFVGFAVAGLLGFSHAAMYHGLGPTFLFYLPVFKSITCYSLGVIVYGLLIPERWCPGSIFDYFGMSHNLWHICVFGGIYYHYIATVDLLKGARDFSCSA